MLLTCNTQRESESWAAQLDFGRLSVAGNRAFVPQAAAVLQTDELRRAQRYHRAEEYSRFLLARAALRLVVGAYVRLPPAHLRFKPGVNKKPLLREVPGLHYNVSHAGDWVLLAVATAEVDIDVERLDPLFTFQDILDHSFSLDEKVFIERSPVPYKAFYQLWTRKEAFVKATGRGIDAEFSQMPALDG
jgi:4'-phosphopantetheinyl transferase